MSGFIVESPNAQRATDEGGRVRDVPRPNFVFYYHPAEWQLDERGELIPSIGHFSLAPGSGADPNGDFSQRHAEMTSKGFVRIPHDVLGAALPDYVAKYTNHRGKAVHRTVFQTPYNDGTGTTRWLDDIESRRAFVAFLRRKGLIARPRPEVVEGKLREEERKLGRLADTEPASNALARDRYAQKVARGQHAIETLQAELAESIAVYGRPVAPARGALLALLQADETVTPEAEAVVRKVRTRKPKPEGAPAPAEPAPTEGGGFELGGDDE